MSSFILNSNGDIKKIVEFKKTKSYTFSPKQKSGTFHSLKTVNVYDEERVNNIIVRKYTRMYQRLSKIVRSIIECDDATEGDVMIALDEISKLQSILIIKYQELLVKETYEYFLNDLYLLEKIMKDKLIDLRSQGMYRMGGV